MSLRAVMEKLDDIPESFRELYTERDGKFELTGIAGVKTEEDVRRVQGALEKERKDHKAARDALGVWGDLKHDEVMSKLDAIPTLEAAAAGKLDDEKLSDLVEKRSRSMLAPVERKASQLEKENAELKKSVAEFQLKETRRAIHDSLSEAGTEAKILPTALEDAKLLGERVFKVNEDGTVTTEDGLSPSQWLADMQEKRPHWWPASQGGGARGGASGLAGFGGKNPFSHEHWNMTEQAKLYNTVGKDKAEQLAKAAGTFIGGPRPSAKK